MADTDTQPRDLLRSGIELAKREQYAQALPMLHAAVDRLGTKAPQGMSYYGLCLAKTGKVKQGIEFVQAALKEEFYNAEHYLVLARIYNENNSRRKAIDAINQGLRVEPENRELHNYRQEMGVRRPPPLRFLARNNPLNRVLGRARHAIAKPDAPKKTQRKKKK